MTSSVQSQAVMLLTVSFGKSDQAGAKPLTPTEWGRFADWLKKHDLEPATLLQGDMKALLAGWTDKKIPLSRLERLMGRGAALGLALEKWQRAGLWIITRSDSEYPQQLKRRLGPKSPPVLFGCGNKKLLNRGGIAVVGSRDAAPDDIAFTKNLGEAAAKQAHSIISGGARGVDESAMLGALENEGTTIGVMANGLLRAATSVKYRQYLLADDLVLITPFNPEAGFNVGNAMARNKYIYCLADVAVVVSSTAHKGGTWNGAVENLKASWVPLWVKRSASANSGNSELVQKGAGWLPDNLASLASLSEGAPGRTAEDSQGNSSQLATETTLPALTEPATKVGKPMNPESETAPARPQKTDADEPVAEAKKVHPDMGFYPLFLAHMRDITAIGPMKAQDIALRLDLEKSQVNAWLKRGVGDGKVKKLMRPARYQSLPDGVQQASQQVSFLDDG